MIVGFFELVSSCPELVCSCTLFSPRPMRLLAFRLISRLYLGGFPEDGAKLWWFKGWQGHCQISLMKTQSASCECGFHWWRSIGALPSTLSATPSSYKGEILREGFIHRFIDCFPKVQLHIWLSPKFPDQGRPMYMVNQGTKALGGECSNELPIPYVKIARHRFDF